jgi:hypothetical protein
LDDCGAKDTIRRIKAHHVSGQDLDVMALIENVFNARKEWMVCVNQPGDGIRHVQPEETERGGGGGDGDDGKEQDEMLLPLVVCVLMSEADGAEECNQRCIAAARALPASRQPSTTGGEAPQGLQYMIDLGDGSQSLGGGGGGSGGGRGVKVRARRSSQSSWGAGARLKAAILTSECAGYRALVKGMDLPLLVFWKS